MATAFLKVINDGVSSLASSIDASELTISVQSGHGARFPSSFPFHITVGVEIMSCTGRATDVLTVTRGVQSTSGTAAAEGAVVTANITEKHISDLNTAVNTLEAIVPVLADGSVDLAGAWDLGNENLTNVDIDSGAIDGAIIGAASPAAITGTTVIGTTLDGPVGSVTPAAVAATTLNASGATVLGSTLSYKGLLPIADPGSGGAIPVTVSGVVPIVTGGAETRTLADPLAVGQEMIIGLKTYGGDCVITVASPVNQANNNTLTGGAAGAYIHLVAIEDGSDIEWRVVANDGWTPSTA